MTQGSKVIEFQKMSGAGNDFILIDNRTSRGITNWQQLAIEMCDRRFGVGADGLLVMNPSDVADFTMLYFNADGSSGAMCGNGGRCIAKHYLASTGNSETTFVAVGKKYRANRVGDRIELGMNEPGPARWLRVDIEDKAYDLFAIDTGAPHVVLPYQESMAPEFYHPALMHIARTIRWHDSFQPSGTNVDIITRVDDSGVRMRTYERGVEAETLACGTGAIATAILAFHTYMLRPPINVHTRSGEILEVTFEIHENSIRNIYLTGSARSTFWGYYEPSKQVQQSS